MAKMVYPGNNGNLKSKAEVEKVFQKIIGSVKEKKHVNELKDSMYDFSHQFRGLAFIISNEQFKQCSNRDYSTVELKTLEAVFGHLQFTTVLFQNLTAVQIHWVVDTAANQTSFHKRSDCFAFVIASHGSESTNHNIEKGSTREHLISGVDEQCISIDNIVKTMSEVKQLNDKPKLFFIQACRSRSNEPTELRIDQGFSFNVDEDDSSICDGGKDSVEQSEKQTENSAEYSDYENSQENFTTLEMCASKDQTEAFGISNLFSKFSTKLSTRALDPDQTSKDDCLIVYSSSTGKQSYGRQQLGGWMLFSFCETIDLLSMGDNCSIELIPALVAMNDDIANNYETRLDAGNTFPSRKSVAVLEHSLVKDVIFDL